MYTNFSTASEQGHGSIVFLFPEQFRLFFFCLSLSLLWYFYCTNLVISASNLKLHLFVLAEACDITCIVTLQLKTSLTINVQKSHGLCNLPLLLNSLFHDTTLNLARVHFESQHQKSGIYCLLVSVILHQSLHFAGI